MRESIHQPWFLQELRTVGQMPTSVGLSTCLTRIVSGRCTDSLVTACLGGLAPLAAILVTGLGSPSISVLWESFFSRSFPKTDCAEFKKELPSLVNAMNVIGWTAEVVAHFIRGFTGVCYAFLFLITAQCDQISLIWIVARRIRFECVDVTSIRIVSSAITSAI